MQFFSVRTTGSGARSRAAPSLVQSLGRVPLFAIPWTAARQASLSTTNSQSLLRLMSVESANPMNSMKRQKEPLYLDVKCF